MVPRQGRSWCGREEEFAKNHLILPLSAHRISVNMTVCCSCSVDSPAAPVLQIMTVVPKPISFIFFSKNLSDSQVRAAGKRGLRLGGQTPAAIHPLRCPLWTGFLWGFPPTPSLWFLPGWLHSLVPKALLSSSCFFTKIFWKFLSIPHAHLACLC